MAWRLFSKSSICGNFAEIKESFRNLKIGMLRVGQSQRCKARDVTGLNPSGRAESRSLCRLTDGALLMGTDKDSESPRVIESGNVPAPSGAEFISEDEENDPEAVARALKRRKENEALENAQRRSNENLMRDNERRS